MAQTMPPDDGRAGPVARLPDIEAARLGALLRRARTARGLTLEQVARETRIPAHHLEALEGGDLAAVPSAFYRRAELRTYARALGVDEAEALAHLDRALQVQPTAAAVPRPDSLQEARLRRTLLVALALVLIIALLGAAFWRVAEGVGNIPPSPVPGGTTLSPLPESEPESAAITDASAAGGSSALLTVSEPLLEGDAARPPMTADAAPDAPGTVADAPLAAPSAMQSGLVITTEPPGARVTVNGIGYGVTPVTIPYVTPGTKRIRVTLDGHRAEERVVQVDDGRRRTVTIPLRTVP